MEIFVLSWNPQVHSKISRLSTSKKAAAGLLATIISESLDTFVIYPRKQVALAETLQDSILVPNTRPNTYGIRCVSSSKQLLVPSKQRHNSNHVRTSIVAPLYGPCWPNSKCPRTCIHMRTFLKSTNHFQEVPNSSATHRSADIARRVGHLREDRG